MIARDIVAERQAEDVLARTIYGEARGEKVRGQEAIAAVVINRLAAAREGRRWWGATVVEICRAPFQFSCWNEGDPNRLLIERVPEGDAVFQICRRIARRAITGGLIDPTRGATHYHTRSVTPDWAIGHVPCARIGRHLFYNTVA